MGERFKSTVTASFQHGCEASYIERLATSDLLSQCRQELIYTEHTVHAGSLQRPLVGTTVLLFDKADAIAVVVGTELVGSVESAECTIIRKVIKEVNGILRATVTRHSAVGNCFTIRIEDPAGGSDEPRTS